MTLRWTALCIAGAFTFCFVSFAQTSSLEGDVKGEDGKPVTNCKNCIQIERKDIKGKYQCNIDKKGHYFHAGLPLGTYKVMVVIDGKVMDSADNVRTTLGDPKPVNFDLHAIKPRQAALQNAAATGTLTKEQTREMSPEQRAQVEKAMKEQQAAMAKNKALNDAYNAGMTAMQAKQYDQAVEAFNKAAEMDPKQVVVWAQLAEAQINLGASKTGPDRDQAMGKGLEAYQKALELKPDDAAYHNNYALALARVKKNAEAQAELNKAAQLDPSKAGQYYYNLGAVLVNTGQGEPACEAFKKALDTDGNYAEAQYQWGNCLFAKATTTAEGKVIPVPGTAEAFQKYLELSPTGPNAEAAKGMLSAINATLDTKYSNPSAPKKGKKK